MKLDTHLMLQHVQMLREVVPLVGTGGGIDSEAVALRRFQDAMKGLQAQLDQAESDSHPDSKKIVARVAALRGEEKKTPAKKAAPVKKAVAKKAPAKKAPAPAPKKGLIARLRGK